MSHNLIVAFTCVLVLNSEHAMTKKVLNRGYINGCLVVIDIVELRIGVK